MPDNGLAPPNMPWLWQPNSPVGQPNGLGPPMLNYAAPPSDTSQGAGAAAAGQQAWQWLQDQRAESVRQGLLDPDTGLPTQKGVVQGVGQTAQGVVMGTTAPGDAPPPGIVAYHGSPHSFDQFDTSKIGTGEGNQAYGHGLYFAEREGVARSYKEGLSPRVGPDHFALMDALEQNAGLGMPEISGIATAQNPRAAAGEYLDYLNRAAPRDPDLAAKRDALTAYLPNIPEQRLAPAGSMYQVNIGADPEHMLQWDQTVGQHPPALRDKLLDMGYGDTDRGADVYSHMARGPNGDVGASERLQDAGIPGISYLDAGSRGAGTGTKNHVVFDANTIDILRKYGITGLIAGGGAAAAATQQQQPSQ